MPASALGFDMSIGAAMSEAAGQRLVSTHSPYSGSEVMYRYPEVQPDEVATQSPPQHSAVVMSVGRPRRGPVQKPERGCCAGL